MQFHQLKEKNKMATKTITYQDVVQSLKDFKSEKITKEEFLAIGNDFVTQSEENRQAMVRILKNNRAIAKQVFLSFQNNEQSTDNVPAPEPSQENTKPKLTKTSEDYAVVLENLAKGEVSLEDVANSYTISKTLLAEITKMFK